MVRRLKLGTGLRLLVVSALVGTIGLGVLVINDRRGDQREAARGKTVVHATQTLATFLDGVEIEATLSARFLTSGTPSAKRELGAARPITDRAARALTLDRTRLRHDRQPDAARDIERVEAAWNVLRNARVNIDRRTVGDRAMLVNFDVLAETTLGAMETSVASTSGNVGRDLRARGKIARVKADVAAGQATLLIALNRTMLSRAIADRTLVIRSLEAAQSPPALTAARQRSGTLSTATLEARTAAEASAKLAAPALLRRFPTVSTGTWLRATDRQLAALRTIGHVLDSTAQSRATEAVTAGRAGLIRALALTGGLVLIELLVGFVLIRGITRTIHNMEIGNADLATRLRTLTETRVVPVFVAETAPETSPPSEPDTIEAPNQPDEPQPGHSVGRFSRVPVD